MWTNMLVAAYRRARRVILQENPPKLVLMPEDNKPFTISNTVDSHPVRSGLAPAETSAAALPNTINSLSSAPLTRASIHGRNDKKLDKIEEDLQALEKIAKEKKLRTKPNIQADKNPVMATDTVDSRPERAHLNSPEPGLPNTIESLSSADPNPANIQPQHTAEIEDKEEGIMHLEEVDENPITVADIVDSRPERARLNSDEASNVGLPNTRESLASADPNPAIIQPQHIADYNDIDGGIMHFEEVENSITGPDTVDSRPERAHLNSDETSAAGFPNTRESLSSADTNPANIQRQQTAGIEDIEVGIMHVEEGVTEVNNGTSWIRKKFSNLAGNLRTRFRGERRVAPPDRFLDKFAAKTFSDPDEPMYQAKRSKLLCGLRLAFDPTISMHYHWLAVVSLAILYNMVFVIGRSVFWEMEKIPTFWISADGICDIIYLIDTIVHIHEAYLENGLLVKDPAMLRKHYIESKAWIYDVISLLPTDFTYFWWCPGTCDAQHLPCPVIVRLNRLFRLPRMWVWFDRTETACSYPNIFRICKVVIAILVLIHWNACLYFALSYAIGFGTDNWVYNLNGTRNQSLAHQYIYSFYWSTLTLTTIGETPQPENDIEYLFVIADFLAGVLVFATIVGNIGSMISNMNVARVDFQNKIDGVKQYMAFRKVGGQLETRVIRWFAYKWAETGALDEELVLSSLPDKLKAEIAIRVHLDTLRVVKLFQDCEPGLLEALVIKLKLQVFSPGDYICRKGDVGKEMYIVKRGRLEVVADDGTTVLATLVAGSVFGEVSVLEIPGNRIGNRRTANVRSLGYSDLFCLAKKDLWEALADYPEAKATLIERGCQLLRKDGLLDEAVFQNAQTTQQTLEEIVYKLNITVDTLSNRIQNMLTASVKEQARVNRRINRLERRLARVTNLLNQRLISARASASASARDSAPASASISAGSGSGSEYDDVSSSVTSESMSEVVGCCTVSVYNEVGASPANDTLPQLVQPPPARERGQSLSVERTPHVHVTPQPRSRSLRTRRTHTYSN